ncbi:MAG: cysteine hydrolase family protein [Lautropia sp.]
MKLGVDPVRAAVLAIDMHRGHLDLSVATMPVRDQAQADALLARAQRFYAWARCAGVPVVHLVTTYRDPGEIRGNPYWCARADDPNATRKHAMRHNIEGSPGCTIMPGLQAPQDVVIRSKKRYDCFRGTDLEFALRARGVNTVLVTGINTNSCVLSTVAAANARDYAVVVVQDCVDTMDDPSLHDAALLCIRTAFGSVMPASDLIEEWPAS